MNCLACGFDNPEGTKFCGDCGAKLGVNVCPKCQFESPPSFKFCGECGEPLAAPKRRRTTPVTPDHAERRQLTVLFADLADSTALAEKFGPEAFRDIVNDYQAACNTAIQEFGGHVAQYLGDGILVYFGYPQAHEDDARRAVHAGLGIVSAVRVLSDRVALELGVELFCRVGIHTGDVVTGEVGAGDTRELLALGQAPSIAARVQGEADPNTVLVTGAVDNLVRGYFDCESLGSRSIKGVSKPVDLFRVIKHSGVRDSIEVAITRGLTPVAGRQTEIDEMLERVRVVCGGKGQAVLVAGEGGIGKSRLVQILRDRTPEDIPTWFVTRCSQYHQQSALSPFVDLVHEQLGITQDMKNPERLRRLEKSLINIDLPVDDLAPPLAEFINIPTAGHYPPSPGTPQKRRERILEALLAVLLRVAENEPVGLVTEDLHWADPSTLDLLKMIIERSKDVRLLIVMTHRPGFSSPWAEDDGIPTLQVSRLGRDSVISMIGALTGGMAMPPDLLDQILEKTDGVPLYVEELTKMILESDLLRPGSMGYELAKPLPQLSIPTTLQDSLMARLDRQGDAKQLAQLAAVLGREFSYHMIHAVAGFDDQTIQMFLGQLVEAGVFNQSGILPDASYAFNHALVEDAAYSSLVKNTRQAYHKRVAEVITSDFPDELETRPEVAAKHWSEAGEGANAIGLWMKAAKRAIDRFANLEAADHLRAALTLLEQSDPSPQRYGQEIAIQTMLGSAIISVQGYTSPAGREAFARALELSEPMGDIPDLFRALQGLWMFHVVRADYDQALQIAQRLQRSAPESDRALRMQGHYCVAFTLFFLGQFEQAQTEFEMGITLDGEGIDFQSISPTGDDIRVHVLCFMALNLWHLGYPDQASEQMDRAVDHARRSEHPYGIAWALCLQGWLHQFRREAEEAFSASQESLAIAHGNGFSYIAGLSNFLVGLGFVQTVPDPESPQVAQGIGRMQGSVRSLVSMGARLGETLMLTQLIENMVRIGRLDVAQAALEQNRQETAELEERAWEAEFHRQTGEIALYHDELDRAEDAFRHAAEQATAQGAISLELRAKVGLARTLARKGNPTDGRTSLEETLERMTEGTDTGDLVAARTTIEELV